MIHINCCHGCTDRKIVNGVRCHSWCQTYKDEVAEHHRKMKEYTEGAEAHQYACTTVTKKLDKAAKRHKRRGNK